MTFGEKVKKARINAGMSQTELGEKIGVSCRAITAYERENTKPRPSKLLKLAEELKVSTYYLSDDNCDNPLEGIARDPYINEARARYGSSAVHEMESLLSQSKALFAGGELSDEEKEKFFQAITEAYFACREEARRRYGKKNDD